MKPRELWRRCAVAAAAGTLALGLAVDLPPGTGRATEPVWAVHLAPLQHAPLPAGRPVSLVLPPAFRRADRKKLLMETVWQRPEVDWLPATGFPPAVGPRDALVLAPGAEYQPLPPGWTRVWGHGWVQLFRRNGP